MENVRVGSVCSSVGGMDLGFERAGYTTQWVCEVDPWRRKILAKHFPQAEQHEDLTTLDPAVLAPVDVLIGGTPCQDLSHAGNRAGLEGERSRLFWDYMRIRNAMNIPWAVWENVYGALTSNNGLDFAQVLGAFVGCPVDVPAGGWPGAGVAAGPWGGCCWRVLDAQHFGVPQRRRRVFVVGHLGGECPPSVLFESEGRSRDPQTGRVARPNAPDGLGGGVAGALDRRRGGADDNEAQAGQLVVGTLTKRVGKGVDSDGLGMPLIAGTLRSHSRASSAGPGPVVLDTGAFGPVAHTLRAEGHDGSEDGSGRGTPLVLGEPARGSAGSTSDSQPGEGWREAGAGLPSSADRVDGSSAHPDGMRTPYGLAGRVDDPVSPCGCPWDFVDGGGFCACCAAHVDDPNGLYALQGDGTHNLTDCPRYELVRTAATLTKGSSSARTSAPGRRQEDDANLAVAGQALSRAVSAFDPLPDGRRYSACGDGVVAPVAEWIGNRLAAVMDGQVPQTERAA